ncbi:MAG: multidrug effflux MFS transporter [Ferrovibrio sp.]|uniref:multidrug effflux MFS transporter n=1 Tax=Ferrovibrio sp. TaxID=1917215 RepID=UPI002637DEB1|nr:multidrug effflux MFS transporter [Ferrovibrio sp.]MCW0236721.1 multidrug effflux MFS transporter [Ferrovibrio sp.]
MHPSESSRGPARFLRNALILGLLTAIGPFAIDMYLPSLPFIGSSLNADSDKVLMSLTAFFITFAFGQLVFGPISDITGRRAPLYFGIVLFIGASIGCALAENVETLIAFRFLQGLGGAAGIVIPRAIVRDLHSGVEEARLLGLLMLVFSVSPLLAPLFGSVIIEALGWRTVFWFVAGIAVLAGGLGLLLVPETRSPAQRAETSLGGLLATGRQLFTDRTFMGLTLATSFAISAFFVFLANAPFVMMGQYGLSPVGFSITFSLNAAAFFFAAQFCGRLGARYGLKRLIMPSIIGFTAAMVLVFALNAAGLQSLVLTMALLLAGYGCLGILLPTASVLALESYGEAAGMASSLMATLQLAVGAIVIGVSGKIINGAGVAMTGGIALCAVATLAVALLTLRGSSGQPAAAE